jgi:hypothetical protein
VSLPIPVAGLVIRYAYLWKREHDAGREEGVKDRPCAVILAVRDDSGDCVTTVLPITHSPPADPTEAVEVPSATKQRLGLDDERSWIVATEANRFIWPGPDLRPLPGRGLESIALGLLPRALYLAVRDRFLELDRKRKAALVQRSE